MVLSSDAIRDKRNKVSHYIIIYNRRWRVELKRVRRLRDTTVTINNWFNSITTIAIE